MLVQKKQSAFIRGFSKVLELSPSRATRLRFVFRGRDLQGLSISDAIGQDWMMVRASLASAIAEAEKADGGSKRGRSR